MGIVEAIIQKCSQLKSPDDGSANDQNDNYQMGAKFMLWARNFTGHIDILAIFSDRQFRFENNLHRANLHSKMKPLWIEFTELHWMNVHFRSNLLLVVKWKCYKMAERHDQTTAGRLVTPKKALLSSQPSIYTSRKNIWLNLYINFYVWIHLNMFFAFHLWFDGTFWLSRFMYRFSSIHKQVPICTFD